MPRLPLQLSIPTFMATTLRTKEKCLFKATLFISYKLERGQPPHITLDFIRSLHKEIYRYNKPAAGNFRTPVYDVVVRSETFKPIDPNMIRIRLSNLTMFINNKKVKAATYGAFTRKIRGYQSLNNTTKKFIYALFCGSYVHHQITIIHPFTGGNGRLARLLMSMELANHNLYNISFPPLLNTAILINRTEYLDALEAADKGNLIKFVMFLSNIIAYSIKNETDLVKKLKKRLGN